MPDCGGDVNCVDFPCEKRQDTQKNQTVLKLFVLPFAITFALVCFGNDESVFDHTFFLFIQENWR